MEEEDIPESSNSRKKKRPNTPEILRLNFIKAFQLPPRPPSPLHPPPAPPLSSPDENLFGPIPDHLLHQYICFQPKISTNPPIESLSPLNVDETLILPQFHSPSPKPSFASSSFQSNSPPPNLNSTDHLTQTYSPPNDHASGSSPVQLCSYEANSPLPNRNSPPNDHDHEDGELEIGHPLLLVPTMRNIYRECYLKRKTKGLDIEEEDVVEDMVSYVTEFRKYAFCKKTVYRIKNLDLVSGLDVKKMIYQIKNLALGVDVKSLDEMCVHCMVYLMGRFRTKEFSKKGKLRIREFIYNEDQLRLKSKSKEENESAPFFASPLEKYPCTKYADVEVNDLTSDTENELKNGDIEDVEIIDLTSESDGESEEEDFDDLLLSLAEAVKLEVNAYCI